MAKRVHSEKVAVVKNGVRKNLVKRETWKRVFLEMKPLISVRPHGCIQFISRPCTLVLVFETFSVFFGVKSNIFVPLLTTAFSCILLRSLSIYLYFSHFRYKKQATTRFKAKKLGPADLNRLVHRYTPLYVNIRMWEDVKDVHGKGWVLCFARDNEQMDKLGKKLCRGLYSEEPPCRSPSCMCCSPIPKWDRNEDKQKRKLF